MAVPGVADVGMRLALSWVWLLNILKDIVMNTRISQKLTAVAIAVIVNAAIMGGVAYLFSNTSERPTSAQRSERHDGGAVGVSARSTFVWGRKGLVISI
jgi:hypothetical protein